MGGEKGGRGCEASLSLAVSTGRGDVLEAFGFGEGEGGTEVRCAAAGVKVGRLAARGWWWSSPSFDSFTVCRTSPSEEEKAWWCPPFLGSGLSSLLAHEGVVGWRLVFRVPSTLPSRFPVSFASSFFFAVFGVGHGEEDEGGVVACTAGSVETGVGGRATRGVLSPSTVVGTVEGIRTAFAVVVVVWIAGGGGGPFRWWWTAGTSFFVVSFASTLAGVVIGGTIDGEKKAAAVILSWRWQMATASSTAASFPFFFEECTPNDDEGSEDDDEEEEERTVEEREGGGA